MDWGRREKSCHMSNRQRRQFFKLKGLKGSWINWQNIKIQNMWLVYNKCLTGQVSMCPVWTRSVSHLVPVIYTISSSSRFHSLSRPGLGTLGLHTQLLLKPVHNDLLNSLLSSFPLWVWTEWLQCTVLWVCAHPFPLLTAALKRTRWFLIGGGVLSPARCVHCLQKTGLPFKIKMF